MKKTVLIFLVLALSLCLASCSTPSGVEAPAPVRTEFPTPAPTEAPTPEPTEDPMAGWMEVGYGVWIPEIPFQDWDGQMQDNINCYTMFINDFDADAFHAYAQSLPGFGYELEVLSDSEYSATDPEGNSLFLWDRGDGKGEISVYKAK